MSTNRRSRACPSARSRAGRDDDPEPGAGQDRDLVAPQPSRVGEPVQQDHRPARPGHLVVDARFVAASALIVSAPKPPTGDRQQLARLGPEAARRATRRPSR